MQYEMKSVAAEVRYRLLASTIVPRPIAWVTSCNKSGLVNLAPFSYFNLMGHNPAVIVLGFAAPPGGNGQFKDTPENIIETDEFIVHLVSEGDAEKMNLTAMDAPSDFDEAAAVGLELVSGSLVAVPRIKQSAVAFECVKRTVVMTGRNQLLVVAEVLYAHVEDKFLIDAEKGYVDTDALRLVARMHGSGFYARMSDLFTLERRSFSDYVNEK
jgi:flavin reductase (DIM6/NTAB) family NADH-FMN oxidoreductase RutF